MAGVDILSDSTGKSIVAAIKSTDVAQARISEINQAAELKKNEVLASIPEDYRNTVDEVNQIKGDIVEISKDFYSLDNLNVASTTLSRALTKTGTIVYNTNGKVIVYAVEPNTMVYIKASADFDGVWQFQNDPRPGQGVEYIIGGNKTTAVDRFVVVPNGATYLVIAQNINNTTNVAKKASNGSQREIDIIRQDNGNMVRGVVNGYLGDNGSLANPTANKEVCTEAISVTSGEEITVLSLSINSNYWYRYCFYDETMAIVGSAVSSTVYKISDGKYFGNNDTIVVPSGAKYFRFSFRGYDDYQLRITRNDDIYTTHGRLKKAFSMIDENNIRNRKNNNVSSVAHQGYAGSEQIGYSKLSAYVNAGKMGFDYGECDIKWTSDGLPVCSHDATFTDEKTGNTITIAEHTLAELMTYQYHGETIASLDNVLKVCKQYGMGLFIDQLNVWDTSKWQTLFNYIKKYDMVNKIVWLTVNPNVATIITDWDSNAVIGATWTYTSVSSVIATINSLKKKNAKIIVNLNVSNLSVDNCVEINQSIPVDCKLGLWIVDDEAKARQYLPYVSYMTSDKINANLLY